MQILRLAAVVLAAGVVANTFGSATLGALALGGVGAVGALLLRRRTDARTE